MVLLGLVALMAVSCARNPEINVLTDVPKPDVDRRLLVPCPNPVSVPKRDLKRGEVVRLWNGDRTRLRRCAKEKAAITKQLNRETKLGSERDAKSK